MKLDLLTNAAVVDDAIGLYLADQKTKRRWSHQTVMIKRNQTSLTMMKTKNTIQLL
jgi:hypothetical protein